MRKYFLLCIILCSIAASIACASPDMQKLYNQPYKTVYSKSDYRINFQPIYPLLTEKDVFVRLWTDFYNPIKVSLLIGDNTINLIKQDNYWFGSFVLPSEMDEGWHKLQIVFIEKDKTIEKEMWYRAFSKAYPPGISQVLESYSNSPTEKKKTESLSMADITEMGEDKAQEEVHKSVSEKVSTWSIDSDISGAENLFSGTSEVPGAETSVSGSSEIISSEVASSESTLKIKGTKLISFSTRNVEGTNESFIPGRTREESLRLNISGQVDGTTVNADIFSTSTLGMTNIEEKDDKVSILLQRASTEVYLGDFNARLDDVEFASIDRVLRGVKVKGDYDKWGIWALYSTPRGESKTEKMYGDNTQGPFQLNKYPVVIDSEKVYIDGILQKRGDDYTFDYQAGTVTFKNRIIIDTSIIKIDYDFRETTYSHSTYGLRVIGKPYDGLKVGSTYLNDSDNLSDAENIRSNMNSSSAIDPMGHHLIGIDAKYNQNNLQAETEFAYSERDLNLLSSASKESGKAAKIKIGTNYGDFGIEGYWKKIGRYFRSIGNASPKQDEQAYGGILSYRPTNWFSANIQHDYDKYLQDGVYYKVFGTSSKAKLSVPEYPSFAYFNDMIEDSNDPVSGIQIDRLTNRNAGEAKHTVGIFDVGLRGEVEERVNRSPSTETTVYQIINASLATTKIQSLTFASNIEYKKTKQPNGGEPRTKTYDARVSYNPNNNYLISTTLQQIDDTDDGISNVLDLSYRAVPWEYFKTNGTYRIDAVKEAFGITDEAVSKQSGSLQFDYQPIKPVRLRYYYKPNFTYVHRTNSFSYDNDTRQSEVMWSINREMLLGATYKITDTYTIDKNDFTNLSRKQSTGKNDSVIYTFKSAPFSIMSLELNYLIENGISTNLTSVETSTYSKVNDKNNKFDASIKTSLSEKFSIDSRYTYQEIDQGSGEAIANTIDTISHTGFLKGIWRLNENWTINANFSFSKSRDMLQSTDTYTSTPGCGFIYALGSRLRVDGEYSYSKSYVGSSTEKINLSLKTKYQVSQYVNFILQADQEQSLNPDYKVSEFQGNLEIIL